MEITREQAMSLWDAMAGAQWETDQGYGPWASPEVRGCLSMLLNGDVPQSGALSITWKRRAWTPETPSGYDPAVRNPEQVKRVAEMFRKIADALEIIPAPKNDEPLVAKLE